MKYFFKNFKKKKSNNETTETTSIIMIYRKYKLVFCLKIKIISHKGIFCNKKILDDVEWVYAKNLSILIKNINKYLPSEYNNLCYIWFEMRNKKILFIIWAFNWFLYVEFNRPKFLTKK